MVVAIVRVATAARVASVTVLPSVIVVIVRRLGIVLLSATARPLGIARPLETVKVAVRRRLVLAHRVAMTADLL
jgi:hypothetical protein